MEAQAIFQTQSVQQSDYDLLRDDFSPREAKELILRLIHDQTNFYKLKNLSRDLQGKTQSDEIWSRVGELNQMKEEVQEMIELARKTGCKLKVSSQIHIELDDTLKQN